MIFKVMAPPEPNRFPVDSHLNRTSVVFDRVEAFEATDVIEVTCPVSFIPASYLGPIWDQVVVPYTRGVHLSYWHDERSDPTTSTQHGPGSTQPDRPNRRWHYLYGDYRMQDTKILQLGEPTEVPNPLKVNYVTIRRCLDNNYVVDEHIIFNCGAYMMTEDGKTFEKWNYTWSSVTRT